MSLKDKYQPVLELMDELDCKNKKIWVDRGSLFIRANAKDERSRNLILHKVEQINVEEGHDIDIKIGIN